MYVWKVCEAPEPRLEDGCLRHRASELLQFADAQRSGTAARLTNQKSWRRIGGRVVVRIEQRRLSKAAASEGWRTRF